MPMASHGPKEVVSATVLRYNPPPVLPPEENPVPDNLNRDNPLSPGTFLFIAALFTLWGGNVVAVKAGLRGLPPFGMAALRFVLAGLFLAVWMRAQDVSFRLVRRDALHHTINGLSFAAQIGLFYLGVERTSASYASILINSNPFFVLLLAHYFVAGDRLTPQKVLGLILALSGVAFLFAGQIGGGRWLGNALVVVSAALLAGRIVYVKRLISTIEPSQVVFWQMVVGVPLFLWASRLTEAGRAWHFSPTVTTAVLFQGIVVGGFCFLAATTLLQRHNPSTLSAFSFIIPLSGVALSHVLLGDPMTRSLALSAALVALGIVLVHRPVAARSGATAEDGVEIPTADPYH
jgi:drug/metabolite transporter (DMT)-like permease